MRNLVNNCPKIFLVHFRAKDWAYPKFFVLLDCEKGVDHKSRTRDQKFEGVTEPKHPYQAQGGCGQLWAKNKQAQNHACGYSTCSYWSPEWQDISLFEIAQKRPSYGSKRDVQIWAWQSI